MRKVRYSMAASLDGLIAGPNGEHDWVIMDPGVDFRTFLRRHVRDGQTPRPAVASVAQLKTEEGKDIWLMGGGGLFRSLLEAKLIDTIEAGLVPVMPGAGVPLLPDRSRRSS